MAGENYQKHGTPVVWADIGGDEQLDLGGLAADGILGGSLFDRGDLSATPAPDEYEWQMVIGGFATAPVVGETVDLYFAQGDTPTQFDGQIASNPTDAIDTPVGPTADMLKNMMYAGSAIVHSATASDGLIVRGVVRFSSRYFVPVLHNNTADGLLGTAGVHSITLTPIFYQVQQ